eukprot:scaffold17625_cov139-Amphora_coffeaeformis.AAC.2
MPAWNSCPRLPPMDVPILLLPSTVLVALADEIIFHGHVGMEWLPLVAPNGGSHTPIAIYSSCGIGITQNLLVTSSTIPHSTLGKRWNALSYHR